MLYESFSVGHVQLEQEFHQFIHPKGIPIDVQRKFTTIFTAKLHSSSWRGSLNGINYNAMGRLSRLSVLHLKFNYNYKLI